MISGLAQSAGRVDAYVWRGKIAGIRFSESNAKFASKRIAGKIGR